MTQSPSPVTHRELSVRHNESVTGPWWSLHMCMSFAAEGTTEQRHRTTPEILVGPKQLTDPLERLESYVTMSSDTT